MLRLFLLALALTLPLGAAAQIPLLDVRVGAHAAQPRGEFADAYDAGLGAYARVGVPLLFTKIVGSATYTRFAAANPLVSDLNQTTLQVGPHTGIFPFVDLGLEAAYLSEGDTWAFAPNLSVSVLMFEATASYTRAFKRGGPSWVTLGLGLRF